MTVIESSVFPSCPARSSQRLSRLFAVLVLLSAAVPEAESADCCDAYSVVTDVSKIMGLEIDTYRASASSVGNCSWGEQCIPCVDENGDSMPVNSCQANPSCTEGGLSGICIDCLLGNYCPAGTINKYGMAVTTLCPDGEYCTPEMTGSRWSGGRAYFTYEYDKQLCPAGQICPAGTVAVDDGNSCQEYVVDFIRNMLPDDVPADAPSGYHCAEGTSGFEMLEDDPSRRLQECKEGNYCPTANEQLLCTSGHYCKKRVASPQRCPNDNLEVRSICTNEGNTEPEPTYSWLIAFLFTLLVFMGAFRVSDLLLSKQSAQQAAEFLRAVAEANKRFTFLKQVLQGIDISSLGGAPKGFHICITPTTIVFEGLTLVVGNLTLLDRVSGIFAHSRMVAVMGPSGCGKSSLLNTLCGKAAYGEQSGHITINNVERPISDIKNVTGFVPQDDTVFGDLTVLENLTFTYAPQRGDCWLACLLRELSVAPNGDCWLACLVRELAVAPNSDCWLACLMRELSVAPNGDCWLACLLRELSVAPNGDCWLACLLRELSFAPNGDCWLACLVRELSVAPNGDCWLACLLRELAVAPNGDCWLACLVRELSVAPNGDCWLACLLRELSVAPNGDCWLACLVRELSVCDPTATAGSLCLGGSWLSHPRRLLARLS
ncbi:hypothetical protein CYMTET_18650, partial [Cymbomonas tetramitiformis]